MPASWGHGEGIEGGLVGNWLRLPFFKFVIGSSCHQLGLGANCRAGGNVRHELRLSSNITACSMHPGIFGTRMLG